MLRTTAIAILCAGLLAGCSTISESRYNPMNWGKSKSEVVAKEDLKPLVPPKEKVQSNDNRTMIARVDKLSVADVQGGVMITATGTPSVAGVYNVELVRTAVDQGTLTLEFRVQRPEQAVAGRISPVTVSHILNARDAAGIRTIRVTSRNNSITRRN